jgi:arylsulfatase A-like enzyme
MTCLAFSMKLGYRSLLGLTFVSLMCVGGCTPSAQNGGGTAPIALQERPNVVIILADDLGIADLAIYGGEIETPAIERLAAMGTTFSRFHTAPMCSPSRAMLLTGVAQHRTGYGTMEEFLADNQRGQPGYEGFLSTSVVTVGDHLQRAGYDTYMTGKWHLGLTQLPSARGFDRTFVLVDGAASHYDMSGYSSARPVARFMRDGEPTELPEAFYSSDGYTDALIEMIGNERSRPFLAYLSFTAPHWPLHAPAESIARYDGVYEAGWDVIRAQRFERMRAKGIVDVDAEMPPRPEAVRPWATLSADEQRYEARLMAVYAGMIYRLDWNIGRLLDHLEATGELERTVFVFLSDNGPDAVDFARGAPQFGPVSDWVAANFDNSLERLGDPSSYPFYGLPWATVSAAPHRLHKTVVTEGGTRVPLVIAGHGVARRGHLSHELAGVLDVLPTLLELTGVEPWVPEGRHAPDGSSLAGYLRGRSTAARPADAPIVFELFGHRAVHQGPWKLMSLRPPHGTGEWRLFDAVRDPGELADRSHDEPELRRQLLEVWDGWAEAYGIVLPPEEWRFLP